ncbi:hypothetical protein PMAYCL1PPCAC_21279, partial [Pristionchus mayeri]
ITMGHSVTSRCSFNICGLASVGVSSLHFSFTMQSRSLQSVKSNGGPSGVVPVCPVEPWQSANSSNNAAGHIWQRGIDRGRGE